MYILGGGCHCGDIRLELSLTQSPAAYSPRACDCDFCRRHAAAYVSDPAGSLAIAIDDSADVARYRQGSGNAEFLVCARCGVLVAVLYQAAGRLFAAANARAVNGGRDFDAEQTVSPRTLAAEAKQDRWRQVWFSTVRLTGNRDAN